MAGRVQLRFADELELSPLARMSLTLHVCRDLDHSESGTVEEGGTVYRWRLDGDAVWVTESN
jgi:hypothetical protein